MKNFNWLEQREKKAFIAFEDGDIYYGYSIGANNDTLGEVVFNTGMTGYEEILSDPSYAGQIVTMTYTEIGSVGINSADMESERFFANGFIINNYNEPSNWRSQISLQDALIKNNIPCLAGIDTRALTIKLRNSGTLKAMLSTTGTIAPEEAIKRAKEWCGLDGQDYAQKVSTKIPYTWDDSRHNHSSWGFERTLPKSDINIVALDYGIKFNILRNLKFSGMNVKVIPANSNPEDILKLKPQGLFISNGPADPSAIHYAIKTIRELLG
ncbi:MAG TPA: carbamoyl phosphate synthase small subunit, partial [Victivallales bacterium]|nr:carbamoyl phosphate synthase small subunit [Victivallales bacterium]